MSAPTPLPRRVRDIMTPHPRTVHPWTEVAEAYSLMTEGGFRHLVVILQSHKVCGMVSDRDILKHMPPPSKSSSAEQGKFSHLTVSHLMSQPALTVAPEAPIETAVDVMLAEHVSALAVVDADQRLLGVITLVDLARLAGWLIRSLPIV